MIVKNQMKYNKSYCTKTKRKSSNRHFQNFPAQNKIASSKNTTIRQSDSHGVSNLCNLGYLDFCVF